MPCQRWLHCWRDGTTQQGTPPLEFMQRLAALVPRPGLHLNRFHSVPAPSSITSARPRALVVPQQFEPPAQAAPHAQCEANCAHHRPVRLSWAELLKRVFDLDLEHGPNCGGELKIIAAILEQPVIEKILTHLGLRARAPPRAAARGQALQGEPGRRQPVDCLRLARGRATGPARPAGRLSLAQPSRPSGAAPLGRGGRLRPGLSLGRVEAP